MTTGTAARAVLGSIFEHLRANQAGAAVGRDPEYVHQMRVAVRRLRCALRLFACAGTAGLRRDMDGGLRDLGHALGQVRDLDVALGILLPVFGASTAQEAGAAGELLHARLSDARAGLRAHLNSVQHERLMTRLALWLGAGAGKRGGRKLIRFARHAMTDCFKAVEHRAGQIEDLDAAQKHRLRIAVKRARYAAEFLHDLYPGAAMRRYLAVLVQAQEQLGSLTDINMVRALLRDLGLDARLQHPLSSGLVAAAPDDGQLHRDFDTIRRLAGFWRQRKSRRSHV